MSAGMMDYTNQEFLASYHVILETLTTTRAPSPTPRAFLLGGQSGAGKSNLTIQIENEYGKNMVTINADEYRKFHPHIVALQKMYDKDSVLYTQKFSGQMAEGLINTLSDDLYNLVIEGTLRTVEVPKRTACLLKSKGYQVDLAVMAVKPTISYLSTLLRYEKMLELGQHARATPKKHHDLIVENIPANLARLYQEQTFDNIQLYDRQGVCLYNMRTTPTISPEAIICAFFSAPLTPLEEEFIHKTISAIQALMEKRQASPEETAALSHLISAQKGSP